jgi:hypothetical protein
MKETFMKYMKGSVFVILTIYAVLISSSFAVAGEDTMQKNLTDITDLISKWSKQLSTGKLDFNAQKKLGEIMSQMSKVLHNMTMKDQGDRQMDSHNKIMEMEKAWDPFDNSDRM